MSIPLKSSLLQNALLQEFIYNTVEHWTLFFLQQTMFKSIEKKKKKIRMRSLWHQA